MYKCLDCGNTEKFLGEAQESGSVEIYRTKNGYDWAYKVSDSCWKSNFTIKQCPCCDSKNIAKI
ncbi:MAG: hypothetical protein R6U35_05920 [Candidatus Humimicrobiaceae bacterium]